MKKNAIAFLFISVLLAAAAALMLNLGPGGSETGGEDDKLREEVESLIKGLGAENYDARAVAIKGLVHHAGVEFGYNPRQLEDERLAVKRVYEDWWNKVKDSPRSEWYAVALGEPLCRNRPAVLKKLYREDPGRASEEAARFLANPKRTDHELLTAAAWVAGRTGDEDSFSRLVEVLNTGDVSTAVAAADALRNLGDKKAVPHLWKALGREEFALQEAAAVAIAALEPEKAEGAFLALMESGGFEARLIAIGALEEYGTGKSGPALTELLDGPLGERAHEALKKITGEELPPDKKAWAEYFEDRGK